MKNRKNEISKLVSDRERMRAVNKKVMIDAIGHKNLSFISKNLGVIEWQEDHTKLKYCNMGYNEALCGCYERWWRLDLENMDLMVFVDGFDYAYEYAELNPNSNELIEALDQIELALKIHIE